MKIALIQTNPVIGAFTDNTKDILSWAVQAREQNCDLAIFPELAICGYPPQDLLEHHSFLEAHDRALNKLMDQCPGIGVLCGGISRHIGPKGKFLHNSAFLFQDGDLLFTSHKKLLPSYDVFDENRYFEPGETEQSFYFNGMRLGITICEDIFNDQETFSHPLYQNDPVATLFAEHAKKPDLLINIAASPYSIGKAALRRKIFSQLCVKYQLPLLYVNQVGGQDSILFDGRCLMIDQNGHLVQATKPFVEEMLIIDTNGIANLKIPAPAEFNESEEVIAALVMGTRDYVHKCGFKKTIIGLSGGIDSALTAAIAVQALGCENVMGVALPSPYSSNGSVEDARRLAANLNIRFETVPISPLFQVCKKTLAPLFLGLAEDVTEQNIQARLRGMLLMALANKFDSLLLNTGNKSELAVGYCTLYGDMNGGLAVISDLPKMLVYDLARYLNRKKEIIPWSSITKPPSAELAPDQTDQDDLPPYEILDSILKAYLEDFCSVEEIIKMGFNQNIVEDIIRRVKRNEYKRKQAPMGLKVTGKAFGFGRRYPTAEQFED